MFVYDRGCKDSHRWHFYGVFTDSISYLDGWRHKGCGTIWLVWRMLKSHTSAEGRRTTAASQRGTAALVRGQTASKLDLTLSVSSQPPHKTNNVAFTNLQIESRYYGFLLLLGFIDSSLPSLQYRHLVDRMWSNSSSVYGITLLTWRPSPSSVVVSGIGCLIWGVLCKLLFSYFLWFKPSSFLFHLSFPTLKRLFGKMNVHPLTTSSPDLSAAGYSEV